MQHRRSEFPGRRGRPPKIIKDPIERFWSKVDKNPGPPHAGCWLWMGSVDRGGYGRFSGNSQWVGAHKYSLELALGYKLEPGQGALHQCDTRLCVNPDHLFPGTAKQNAHDREMKNRYPSPFERIAELEGELAEARERIAMLEAELTGDSGELVFFD